MSAPLITEDVINSVTTHLVHFFVGVEKDTYSMETISTVMVSVANYYVPVPRLIPVFLLPCILSGLGARLRHQYCVHHREPCPYRP